MRHEVTHPKKSLWLSSDPALGEYIPAAPVNDDAKKHDQNLPGMGGVFNTVNLHLKHYAANNPIKYVDPAGRAITLKLALYFLFHPVEASVIGLPQVGSTGNISSIATNYTINLKLSWAFYSGNSQKMDEGSNRGAFRHALWSALITACFGVARAFSATEAHEEGSYSLDTVFTSLSSADTSADRHNNIIGMLIGEYGKGGPKEYALAVLNYFHEIGLYVVVQNSDGTY